MYRFSYLVTYRESDKSRLSNLLYILDQLRLDSTLEVVLVEQDAAPRLAVKQHSNLNYVFVENAGQFNKSWGLNIAASLASCERLVFADADMLIGAAALDESSKQLDNGVDAVNPYNVLVDLTQQESQRLLAHTGTVKIDRTTEQLNRKPIGQHPPFCGGVFVITRSLYDLTGGLDERFEGWGGEDDAMSKRVAFFASKTTTLNNIGYHLWHEPSGRAGDYPPSYIRNVALLTMYYERQQSFYQSVARVDATSNGSHAKYKIEESVAKINYQQPLISCLCVTRNRVPQLPRAISCFQAQSYPVKELMVVCEADDSATIDYLGGLDDDEIKHHIVPIEPKLNLGELRNLSIQIAGGQFVCQWDDDDWYHPERLAKQLASALRQNKAASILPRWLIHQQQSDKVFCSNVRLWEGSLLCRKSALPATGAYDIRTKGEDSKLIETLFIQDQISIEDSPELYVYCLSGENTWDQAHFEKIIEASVELSVEDAQAVRKRTAVGPAPQEGER
ncbi:MAG: hypothetical protein ACI89S_001705 [Gammaproteobacteria bacterium]|jgi:hypothetical protein